jgi:hypothetical protein
LLTYEFDEPDHDEERFRFRIHHANAEAAKEIAAIVRELEQSPPKLLK